MCFFFCARIKLTKLDQLFSQTILPNRCGCIWLLADEDNEDSFLLTGRAAMTWRTSVQEEVHLMVSQLFKVVLEGIYARCINCFLRKTVKFHLFMLRWENFSVRNPSSLLLWEKKWWQLKKTLTILKSSIRSASPIAKFFERPDSQRIESFLVWQLFQIRSLNILVNRCWTLSNKTLSLT